MKITLIAAALFSATWLAYSNDTPTLKSLNNNQQLTNAPGSWKRHIENLPTMKPFSIRRQGGVEWLVNPASQRFFSLGVCCVDQGIPRDKYQTNNPSYAAWHHYANSNQWAQETLSRLKAWGFTTIGGWSDYQALTQCREAQFAFTPVLHMGSTAGVPWYDMWDPKIISRIEQVARDQILAVRDDPRLLGYYSDNEMGWWNAALFHMTLDQAPSSGQRCRLLSLLRRTYCHDWSKLLKDFDPEGAHSFEELDQRGQLYLRGGSNGLRTMRQFLALAADRYYYLVREIIRKYDRRALILGDRYQSFFYPEVARASARYLDVASGNLNAGWNDGSFARFYVETLHSLTGKPILASEFYMAARENRSGNENKLGFPVVDTQRERVAGFRRTLETLLQIPYVVGADWFQYYDEPRHGRGDGENYNFGLVDIYNQPYESLVDAAATLNCTSLKSLRHAKRSDTTQGVPPAPPDPLGDFVPSLALKHWDREKGYVKPISDFPMADLYICWSPEVFYFGLFAQDVVEEGCYRDKKVPEADRAEWTIQLGKKGRTIRARIGAGAKPVINEPSAQIVHHSGVELVTRCMAAMAVPASLFDRAGFPSGDRIEFASTFHTHGQAYRVEWRGTFVLK